MSETRVEKDILVILDRNEQVSVGAGYGIYKIVLENPIRGVNRRVYLLRRIGSMDDGKESSEGDIRNDRYQHAPGSMLIEWVREDVKNLENLSPVVKEGR